MNLLRNARPYPWGLAFIAGVAAIILLAVSINVNFGLPFNLSLGIPPSQDYTLKAAFRDVNGLARGASVNIAGHNVGDVIGIEVQGRNAVVTMRISRQYAPLHQGTIARLRYSTLLAQKYVELSPAPSWNSEISDGGAIKVDETISPVDFDQFLSTFDPETRARLQSLIKQAGGSLAGRQLDMNDLLAQLHALSMESRPGLSTLSSHDPDLDRIVLNLAITSDTLAANRQQLGDFIQQSNAVNGTVADQSASLAAFVDHFANVMADFDATLAGNEGNLHATVVTLDPTLTELNGLVSQTFVYYDAYKGELITSAEYLIPFIGSAISQTDANGNYLRQYLACAQTSESTNNHFDKSCAAGAPPGPASPKAASPTTPNASSCPVDASGLPLNCNAVPSPPAGTIPPLPTPPPTLDPSALISPPPTP